MAPIIHVAVLGASGETGRSITNALLEAKDKFNVSAPARASSANMPIYKEFAERGASVITYNLEDGEDKLVASLTGIDVIVSAINVMGYADQVPIALAGKKAGIKRFIPSAWSTISPPVGVTDLREMRGKVLNTLLEHYVPYTFVEVGWWYNGMVPKLPSGKLDYLGLKMPIPLLPNLVIGDGNTRTALTDVRDIGRYVARIIADDRTLNKMIFAYGIVTTQNEVYGLYERLSGEKFERNTLTAAQVEKTIEKSRASSVEDPSNFITFATVAIYQYLRSWGIRGDNNPEAANFLGYLDAKELYPDVSIVSLESFAKEALAGTARVVFDH